MKAKWSLLLAVGLVFLLGMVSGGLLVKQIATSRVRSITSSSTVRLSHGVLEHLDQQLGLSSDQRAALAGILSDAVQEFAPLRAEFRGKTLALVQAYRSRIATELNATQRQEFERIVGSLLENWKLAADTEPPAEPSRSIGPGS
jgi:hypothetical protein